MRTEGGHSAVGAIIPSSLRIRLLLIVIAIDGIAAILTGGVVAWKARNATALEIASSMQLADSLVRDTIRLMPNLPAPVLLKQIDLHFQSIRHIRIAVVDESGRLVDSEGTEASVPATSPAWFRAMIAPPIETRRMPIAVGGEPVGAVIVTSEPDDEIGEAWVYVNTLLVTALCLNLVILVALFLAFGRVLRPLSKLASGLNDIERHNYAVRLAPPALAELRMITDHFNRAAEASSAANAANRQLTLRLLNAQDDERRRTALELHDEVGPCLFALEANATSIATMTRRLPDQERIHERAVDVVSLVERLQGLNRRVLDRLRPMALGNIPLEESLIKLLVDFEAVEGGPKIEHAMDGLMESYGFLVDLTIYRCVQEGLFNAVRHARATIIALNVHQGSDDDRLRLFVEVTDDGRGLSDGDPIGLGLVGMRERVEALSGRFEIGNSSKGTRLSIMIPIDPKALDPRP